MLHVANIQVILFNMQVMLFNMHVMLFIEYTVLSIISLYYYDFDWS